jgi:glyoxylate/hydroxypyruvate reductase A
MPNLIVMLRSNPDSWVRLLRAALPGHTVMTDPGEAAVPIDYAVVGKPPPGAIAALGPLQAVFSINAGVEALLESGGVPADVPLVRMVDHGLTAGMMEWVVAQTLAWHRNLFAYRDLQQAGRWAPIQEILAAHRQVALLGVGQLGLPVARMLASLGFPLRAWSRSPKTIEGVESFSGKDGLHAAVTGADILINLLPLTAETENLIDATLLRLLAPGAVLINAARGRHLVDEAVLAALDDGHLRAAVLDVFREEPLPATHPFWTHPGVFLSPHVAAPTDAAIAIEAIAANIIGFENGQPLMHVVDRARGY